MLLRKIIIALFFCLPFCALAQEKDITGLWKGTLFNDTTQKFYKYEIGISKEKGKYSGFSHTWFLIGDTQYFGVKKLSIKIADDGKIIVEDNGLIANNYPIAPNKGVRQLNVLSLDASDSVMKLTGPFTTNRTKQYHSLTGSVSLQRKNDFWQSSLVPHLQELGKDEELSFVKEEKQLLAKADENERQLKIKETTGIVQANKLKEEKEKQLLKEAKLADASKEKIAKAVAKQESASEQQAKKSALEIEKEELAASRRAELEKEKLAKNANNQELAKDREAKKIAAEKEKTDKLLTKKEEAKQTATQKEAGKIAASEKAKDKLAKKEIPAPKPSEIFKTNTEPAANVAGRKTVVQQTVNFSSDSLQLSLYDNGEIDGDTVSVLMNGQLILARQGLGIKAIKHTIYIPHNVDTVEMVMYAETLGAIPPNTGLLVIRDGKDLYEIRFSGDLQKNASIVFNRKKE
jgi:hypothetical protein